MSDHRIEDLRHIVEAAHARDADLQAILEDLGGQVGKELGCETPPQWAAIEAGERERQVNEHFVFMPHEGCLRGDLVIEVDPEHRLSVGIVVNDAPKHQHEAGLARERSQTVCVDLPDPKAQEEARKKFVERVFAYLEGQLRAQMSLRPS